MPLGEMMMRNFCPLKGVNISSSAGGGNGTLAQRRHSDHEMSCGHEIWLEGRIPSRVVVQNVILSISLLLNSTILVAVCSNKKLRSVTNILLSAMATSDIVFATTSNLYGYRIVQVWYPSTKTCEHVTQVLMYCWMFSTFSDYVFLLLISLERWMYIARPFLHQRIVSMKAAAIAVVSVWIFSSIANIDILIYNKVYTVVSMPERFGITYPSIHVFWSILIIAIYSHIAIITRQQLKKIGKTRPLPYIGPPEQNVPSQKLFENGFKCVRDKLRRVRMLVLVFGAFFIMLTPAVFGNAYMAISCDDSLEVLHILRVLLYSHVCSNFFVYALQDRDFRRVLTDFVCRLRCYGLRGRSDATHARDSVYSVTLEGQKRAVNKASPRPSSGDSVSSSRTEIVQDFNIRELP